MILELDCGNSFIKWRVIDLDASGIIHASGLADEPERLLEELLSLCPITISHCRLVSVRSDTETRLLTEVISGSLGVEVVCAMPTIKLAGVTNGYEDFQRLGLDRWLAVVAAYQLCSKSCVVIDLGTAVTIDLVAGDGRHLGGYITPGMALLTEQLRTHTKRILYSAEEARMALSDTSPGRSTSEAVERGCLRMLRSYIEDQIVCAARCLGEEPAIYVTGGDASLFAEARQVEFVPDLVFKGLAIACPL
ncbi:type III pantothenate kinase [Stutzerimonas nitrititolerans]|uniref:type III pantothenate kinase n=1 Tax=Stutzerimonas nitrititolerans TaxID=2482751 RepID=UPI00026D6AE5|nr:type III pantothenate kinase [Stutzerimonas nitrititolerans]AFN79459.1 pantothenate kinase [Stutzerimonas stutzeri DSM 10701]KRW65935.1 type III pantothenate kinase [Pseudomonas sp. TTU2014-066ASC]RRV16659.1 type III pantothenate kinase [Pseudomonas sp. s199]WAD25785.1 type III pantothenate kinase [Pseudomonadaceae bacterium T75]SUD85983.1 pantothenate kinase [Stutzerimonas stutzeri]